MTLALGWGAGRSAQCVMEGLRSGVGWMVTAAGCLCVRARLAPG